MSSPIYFEFLNSVWEQLPEADRERMAELWQGYEQVVAAVYQKMLEVNLNIAVADLQPWSTERWLKYAFSESNYIARPASFISNQDLSAGMNLTSKYLLKFKVDGGPAFEVDTRGYNASITNIFEVITRINAGARFEFAFSAYENSVVKLQSKTVGNESSIEVLVTSTPERNACEYLLGIDPGTLPQVYPKFKHPYTIPYSSVASVPEFRDNVRTESVTTLLEEGTDYVVETDGVINFKAAPPATMWAERTQINTENPWYNYGFLTEIFQANSPRYVGVVQGLWFALWNGPTPANIRVSLYLLFGLPTASEPGVVTSVSETQIIIAGDSGTSKTYAVPSGLYSEVAVGDRVITFQPLVDGISVFDKVNSPGFVESQIGRVGIQRFLTEKASRGTGADTDETKALRMLEEYTFLPQISVESFIYPDINLENVTLFLDILKPICKTYMFQVIVGSFKDLVGVDDRMGASFDINLDSTLDANETTLMFRGFATEQSLNAYNSPVLDAYETTASPHSDEYDGLSLDQQGIIFDDRLDVVVQKQVEGPPGVWTTVLIDSFSA